MARLSAMPSCSSHSIRFVLLLFLLELSTTHLLLVESTSSSHWQNENGNGNNGNRNGNENRNGNGKRQTAAEANCTLVIGGSLSFSPEPASNPQYYQSRHIRDGLLLFQNWSDSQGPIWVDGDLCNFTFKVYDDWGNHSLAKQIYQEFIDNNTADFFITPPSTDMGIAARTITEPNGRLLVGTLVASSFFYIDQPHTFGLCTVETNSFQSGLQLYALQGAKTVAYVVELKSSFFRAQCNAVEENALSSGMSLLDGGGFTVFSSNDVLVDGYWENMTTTAHSLAALDPDVIIVCGHMALPKNLLRALEIVDYMPGAVYYGSLDIPVFEAVPTEHARFVAGAAQWTPLAKKPGDPNIFGTPAQFNETFFNTFGYEAGRSSAVGTTAAILIRLAVERAGTRNQEEVIRALSLINVELFWGRIAFDAHGGLTLRDPDSIQYGFNRELMMVAPSRYATSQVIYPMPTWSERYYDPQYFAYDSEIVIAVLSGVCMLISIGLMIFTVIYWRHIVITAASPLFLLFFLVGSVILDASVFMRMLHTNGVMCILTLWFWAIGFGLMFGALLAKTWRITKIINETKGKNGSLFTKILLWLRIKSEKKHKKKRKQNKFNKVEVITWRKLLLILSVIVGIEVVILSLYTIIAPFFDLTEKVEESELYQSENYTQCELTPVAIVFMVLLAIYNVGLMVWGVILSWMLRNVQWALFNESKAIAFAMYNMFFFSVLIGALEFSGAVSRETMFILRSLGIFAATSISVWVIFAPKIYFILRRVNSLDGSTSKDNKMSLPEVEEIKVERDRGVDTELEEKPEDDTQVRRLKALLRQVRMRMQEGSIALKWEELERSVEMEMGMEDVSSSSSSASSEDMENEEGVP